MSINNLWFEDLIGTCPTYQNARVQIWANFKKSERNLAQFLIYQRSISHFYKFKRGCVLPTVFVSIVSHANFEGSVHLCVHFIISMLWLANSSVQEDIDIVTSRLRDSRTVYNDSKLEWNSEFNPRQNFESKRILYTLYIYVYYIRHIYWIHFDLSARFDQSLTSGDL